MNHTPETNDYVKRLRAALRNGGLDAGHMRSAGLSFTCPECHLALSAMEPEIRADHRTVDGMVAVGCEGYWLVNPALLGLPSVAWIDWRGEVRMAMVSAGANRAASIENPLACVFCSGVGEHYDGCGWVEGSVSLPGELAATALAEPVWTPQTPQERRHAAVAELVAEVLATPQGHRYARAYGILAGFVVSSTPGVPTEWAPAFVRALDEAMQTGLTSARRSAQHAAAE